MPTNWRFDLRCHDCKRFMRVEPGSAWEACGEFGEETRHICKSCASRPDYRPQASNGSRDPRWCGFVVAEDADAD